MSGGVEIFPMQRADLSVVTVLAKQLGYNVTEPELSYRFDAFFESVSEALFVAKKNHQVVGWIHVLTVPPSLLMGPRAEVQALVVDESFRNHGIGKKLLNKGEHWAQQKGFKSVRLRSNVIREDAKKFYLRQGYTVAKMQNTFEKTI